MIQRIQSVYLLLVSILMSLNIFSPIVNITDSNTGVFKYIQPLIIQANTTEAQQDLYLATLSIIVAATSIFTIFLFKKRKKQILLCHINMFGIVVYYILAYFSIYHNENLAYPHIDFSLSYGIIIPIVSFILLFLASNKIKADEKLVRSLDRIR